jgi:hypothetical protein
LRRLGRVTGGQRVQISRNVSWRSRKVPRYQ